MIILIGFISFMTWILIGAFFIYHAQNKMKKWYEYETFSRDNDQLKDLMGKYINIYRKNKAVGKLNVVKLE